MTFQDIAPASFPAQVGNPLNPRYLAYKLDFATYGVLQIDLQRQQSHGRLEFVQSVYIDNSGNQSTLTLVFLGTGQVIVAQPLTQGDYPIKVGTGIIRFTATATPGQLIPIIFSNMVAQGVIWGPTPGANVVPALTNLAIDIAATVIGNNRIIAGLPATTIKIYRLFYSIDAPANIRLVDSNANKWTGKIIGGVASGAAFQATGVPWFTCGVGADFDINTDASIGLGGAIGYVQS